MTASLPPNLLALFEARPLIEYKTPIERKKALPPGGIYSFTSLFEDPKTVDYSTFSPTETRDQRKKRIAEERKKKQDALLEDLAAAYDPKSPNENWTSDPYKTLFVSRISYETTDQKLKREFETFGAIKKVKLIHDEKTGKSRGYAFVEYERERDMKRAYKEADGKKIDGKRVLVDMERARTNPNWKPRRLGGGLGGTRIGGDEVNIKYSGRSPPSTRENERTPSSRDVKPSPTKDSYRSSRDSYRAPARDSYRGERRDNFRRYDDRERDRPPREHRGERSDRGDRSDRGERGERGERGDRGDSFRDSKEHRDRRDREYF